MPPRTASTEPALALVVKALAPCASPALVIGADGRLLGASVGAERLLGPELAGRTAKEVVGLGWRELALVAAEAESDVVVALSVRVPGRARAGWRLRPELLRAGAGEPLAVVAHLEEPAEGGGASGTSSRRGSGSVAFSDLFGDDPQVAATKVAAERFASTRLPILLLAETGTGKDLLARAIHGASPRRDRPFVAINCGALSPHLLESELFGYAPGAFTDARREGHEGRIGAARGGTLFLDEVAEMPGPLQALLLRVLEDGTYFRVGESLPRQADVRLICATCRDLPGMVENGSFRRDLYFRIAGATLSLPPVRERSDVANLVRHVLDRLVANESPARRPPRIARAALERLSAARWPGNVRQIRTALQYALALSDDAEIRPEHLPTLEPGGARSNGGRSEGDGSRLAEVERTLVRRAVDEASGNLSLAARRLPVDR
jgi:transcriptional regulator with PAS, ATPase and Fis domain